MQYQNNSCLVINKLSKKDLWCVRLEKGGGRGGVPCQKHPWVILQEMSEEFQLEVTM